MKLQRDHHAKEGKKYAVNRPVPLSPKVQEMLGQNALEGDPMGSYTGKPAHPWEEPVQDQDDL